MAALTKIFPPGEGELRVTQLLSGLACTYPTRDALYKELGKQLGNLGILRRESAWRAANKTDEPILDVLRKAPILSSSTDEQYSAATLATVFPGAVPRAPEHSFCFAHSCLSSRGHEGTAAALKTVLWTHPRWCPWAWLQRTQALLPAVSVRDSSL